MHAGLNQNPTNQKPHLSEVRIVQTAEGVQAEGGRGACPEFAEGVPAPQLRYCIST
jgi:hypothetical protein